MAQIVSSFCSSHAPMMLAATDAADSEQSQRFFAGVARAAEQARLSGAQAVVIVSNEHFTNFFLENFPQICIGVGESHVAPVERWLGLEPGNIPGHPQLGSDIAEGLLTRGFDPSFSHQLRLDHGVVSVYHQLSKAIDIPLIPILQNCAVPPMQPLRRCYEMGAALRLAIEASTSVEKVALVGTGGISHWVGHERSGEIDVDFDAWFLERFTLGDFEEIFQLTDEQLEEAGNGAHEIRSWVTVAGAFPERTPEILSYEAIKPWLTGMAVASFDRTFKSSHDLLTAGGIRGAHFE
ncbi:hypothetical protein O4328_28580 [Rhodococcus opacus]|uniref:Extradiol ring-cleavage dioxygenase class III enzyme subunit B domain-containing protein n=1 Tax=Rhodococcus opacus TaxID=37919 RepID=A0AAX3YSC3_RHOOP|nr:hypothetical protein [Rhodococcus opacus]MCZ4587597.1 hypothetical protein [Rhodococcus opacus]WLF51405.1 hypothetical protein Q5707_37680 [Rhodococcus opacus]